MEYRVLAKTGLEVSVLSYGASPLGGVFGDISEANGIRTVHTPHFERLAAESLRFARHFCTAPVSSPSRAGLFTGRYPHATGTPGLVKDAVTFNGILDTRSGPLPMPPDIPFPFRVIMTSPRKP